VKNIGKPCAGKLQARFDEGGQVKLAMAKLLRHRQTKGAETDRRCLLNDETCSLLYLSMTPYTRLNWKHLLCHNMRSLYRRIEYADENVPDVHDRELCDVNWVDGWLYRFSTLLNLW